MKRCISCFSFALAACGLLAADRVWQAAGDGDWSTSANWVGGELPSAGDAAVFANALSADAAVHVGGQAHPIGALKLQNATTPWRRVFTGSLVTDLFEQDAGDVVLAGEWRSPAVQAISKLGNTDGALARLEVVSGGCLTLTNTASVYIGNANNARGQLFVREGAEVRFNSPTATASGLYIGRESGSVGAVVQTGGRVEKNTAFIPGYAGYGIYELLGGEFNHPYGNSQTRYRIGMNGPGLFYQRGGVYTASSNGSYALELAKNTATVDAFGLFYCDGGQAFLNAEVKFLDLGIARAGAYAELTVAGAGTVSVRTASRLTLGTVANSRGRAVVNVNGRGTLRLGEIIKGAAAQNTAVLNFDGGTLEGTFSGDRAFFENLTDVVVYGGGANLASSTGRFTLNQASKLRLAQGNGVASVALSDGGSGFAAPPIVTFSGGDGSNATGVAFINYETGSVTGVVVSCRGEGYTSAPAVGFMGGAGSGATAVASLAPNGGGALVFQGPSDVLINRQATFDGEVHACGGRVLVSSRNDASPGMPLVSALRLNGGTFQNGSSGLETDCPYDDMINASAVLIFGGARGSGEYAQPCGPVDNVHSQHFASLQINTGKGRISTTGDSTGEGRRAELYVSGVGREPGGLLYVADSTLASMGIRSGAANLYGVSGPVLAGVFANYADFVTVNPEGDWVRLDAYDDDFGADKNYRMTEAALEIAPEALAVNSVRLTDAASVTLSGAGTTVVESGMITVGSGSAGSAVAGGALTSGNGRDVIVYDAHTGFERRNTSANNVSLRIDSLITDNVAEPVAFVAVGTANVSAMMLASGGTTALTQPTNEYSGGTYVLDTALEPAEDRSLGVVPPAPATNIVTAGMAILRAKKSAWPLELHANRAICLRGGCLALTGDDNNQIGQVITRVNGTISGHGVLVFNHWAGGGVGSVIELNGDNRAFEGTYAVHGILRAEEGVGLSRRANLALCENNDTAAGTRAGGIVEMSGAMERVPGTGAGQVQWCRANDVYAGLVGANDPAYSGGFSAYGGPLSVNLGGDRRVLTLGQDGFNPTVLRLQTDAATDDLTWENPIELAGVKSISVQVARNATTKRVFWRGAISNSAETLRAVTVRQNGKLILCDGADVGSNLVFDVISSLQFDVTNRQTLACDFRGSGPFTKWGAGVTFATGVSTNTGAMRVNEGAWYANGAHTLAGSYTVSNTATLGGAGLVAPAAGNGVTVLGTLAPGAEPGACGVLTLGSEEQATTLTLNGTLALDISAEACDAVAVYGSVVVGDTLALTVTAADEALWISRRGEVIPVLTWTDTLSGTAVPSVAGLPEGWRVKVDTAEKTACLFYVPSGTMIRLR